ncbi:MAG: hypothetical protein JW889_06380 [Verrucomicrobia bacterium]|nr:hypothetical protein [Verrucomicrobiota bacterium]
MAKTLTQGKAIQRRKRQPSRLSSLEPRGNCSAETMRSFRQRKLSIGHGDSSIDPHVPLGGLSARSSETGEAIGGVSLYLPDDGTDRGRPHFKYHDPLYALGIELPDGLTEEVDTMVTSWHNNATYLWDDVELTETGAETNVFSYNEGGLEITVTLDEGAETTAEFDGFGATVYRSDQVNPARRTFFIEADEATNTFESSIFGAQIVLVDGLAADKRDIIEVMLLASSSSASRDFIATETGDNTGRFASQDGVWFVDFPVGWVPTASVDEITVTVFGATLTESQQIRIRETGSETNVLVSNTYISSEDTGYPEPSGTTFHYVEVRRWPGICGDELTVTAITGGLTSGLAATALPSGTYGTAHIMGIPEGCEKPAINCELQFEALPIDADATRRERTWEELKPDLSDKRRAKAAFTVLRDQKKGASTTTKKEAAAFSYLARTQSYVQTRRLSLVPFILVQYYGEDFVASGIPPKDPGGVKTGPEFVEMFVDILADGLGHKVIYDEFCTRVECGSFFFNSTYYGVEAPVIVIRGHASSKSITLVDENNPKRQIKRIYPEWIQRVIQESSSTNTAEDLNVHVLLIGGCQAGGGLDPKVPGWFVPSGQLEGWRKATGAYGVYGATTAVSYKWYEWVLKYFLLGHVARDWNHPLTVDEAYVKFCGELRIAYGIDAGTLDPLYADMAKYADYVKYRRDENGTLYRGGTGELVVEVPHCKAQLNSVTCDPSDPRNSNLDFYRKAIMAVMKMSGSK